MDARGAALWCGRVLSRGGEGRASYSQVLQLLQALEGLLGDGLDLVPLEDPGRDEMSQVTNYFD